MISGRKEAGYGITRDKEGRLIETPFKQCCHCQMVMEHLGSKDKTRVFEPSTKSFREVDTGFCLKCNAVTCMKAECQKCLNKFDNRDGTNRLYHGSTRY